MRLEQCAQSFVRRNIASRGALAVLYGRNMKKYIYKPEVHF
jgi:microspherule protein 1